MGTLRLTVPKSDPPIDETATATIVRDEREKGKIVDLVLDRPYDQTPKGTRTLVATAREFNRQNGHNHRPNISNEQIGY